MTGPCNDRDRLRASHDDRDQVIEVLKSAFVQGRLVKEELDERVGVALASRTYRELGALTDDLPAGWAPPRRAPRPKDRPRDRARAMRVGLAVAMGLVAPVMVVVAILTGSDQLAKICTMPTVLTIMAWLVAMAQMLDNRHSRHADVQRPPQPQRPERRGGVVWL